MVAIAYLFPSPGLLGKLATMALMEGRQDPTPDAPAEEKEARLRALLDWLGEEWVRADDEEHPIRELWRRRDFLATTELLSLGAAALQLAATQDRATMEDAAAKIRSPDIGARAGALFEIWAGSMLQADDQRVLLAAPGQAGYDLEIGVQPERKIRVSCKSLRRSHREELFINMMKQLREHLVPQLQGSATLIKLQLVDVADAGWMDPAGLAQSIVTHVGDVVGRWRGWQYTRGLLATDLSNGNTFAAAEHSYTLLALCPIAEMDQKRLADKIESALAGLREHCPAVDASNTNIAFVRVPSSTSLATAVAELNRRWSSGDYPDYAIAAVILYRPQVAGTPGNTKTFVVHECALANNPNATTPLVRILGGNSLRMTVPIGRVATAETVPLLTDGSSSYSINDQYLFFRSHLYFSANAVEGNVTFSVSRTPNTSTTFIVTGIGGGALRLDFIFPPLDELAFI